MKRRFRTPPWMYRALAAAAVENTMLSRENQALKERLHDAEIARIMCDMELTGYRVSEMYAKGEDGDVSAWRANTILGFPKIPVTAEEDEAWASR